jgi:hypothetical protein
MPSRAVDEAWHEFILDTRTYTSFCHAAFGRYLHHTHGAMGTPMGDALAETVRAWDRSDMGRLEDSILWDLDERLGLEQPLGVDGLHLAAVRSHASGLTIPSGDYAGYVGACFAGTGRGRRRSGQWRLVRRRRRLLGRGRQLERNRLSTHPAVAGVGCAAQTRCSGLGRSKRQPESHSFGWLPWAGMPPASLRMRAMCIRFQAAKVVLRLVKSLSGPPEPSSR